MGSAHIHLAPTLDAAGHLPRDSTLDRGVLNAILEVAHLLIEELGPSYDVYDLDAFVDEHGEVHFVVVGADGYEDFPLELADAIAQDF